MKPMVSIVVPSFNRLHFLVPAIESALNQTFGDTELIVADDGSDEETRTYLRSLRHEPRVRTLLLEHSGNPAIVRNAALSQVRGDYVAFLDSDDVWLPQKVERQLASLHDHPQRRWSCTAFALIDADSNPRPRKHGSDWSAPTGWVYRQLLSSEKCIHMSSVLVSRQLLDEVGGFDANARWCCDLDMWLRLAVGHEVDGIDMPLTLGRRHLQHSCDDVAAHNDHRYVIEKALNGAQSPELRELARHRRAHVSALLANRHGLNGAPGKVMASLLNSIGHSWRYRLWWRAAIVALARSTCPRAARAMLRGLRRVRALLPRPD
jgi:glycosyltransferase involved in cell wall biosynthesis